MPGDLIDVDGAAAQLPNRFEEHTPCTGNPPEDSPYGVG